METLDEKIRLASFNWLRQQTTIHGDVLTREFLSNGFIFENERIPLVAPQGIFKPKWMEFPLSITTTSGGPYEDSFNDKGYLIYKYRGTDSQHRDNIGLRECMQRNIPLIYLHSVIPGKYIPFWPVYIVGDEPKSLSFKVVLDDFDSLAREKDRVYETEEKRIYLTSTIKVRLHQRGFREKVLHAYHSQCTLCRLKHEELLDAAHIIPDGEPESRPTVDNGLSLCKLHHAAFDSYIIGITPNYEIKVRKDVLDENDGPMLQHGLKGLNGSKIILPTIKQNWPNKDFLDVRYQRFRNVIQ